MTLSSCICGHSASREIDMAAVHLSVSTKEGLSSQYEHVGTFYNGNPGAAAGRLGRPDEHEKNNSKISDLDMTTMKSRRNPDNPPWPVVTAEAVRMEENEQDLPSLELSSSSAEVLVGPGAMGCCSPSAKKGRRRQQQQQQGVRMSCSSTRRRRRRVSPIEGNNKAYSRASLSETVPEAIATPIECGSEPPRCMYEDINGSWNRPEYISATVVRESVDVKLGITFSFSGLSNNRKRFLSLPGGRKTNKKRHNNCLPRISDLDDEGLLAEALCVGDLLVSINKQSCAGMSPSELTELLKDLTGTITLVVRHPGGDGSLVESCLLKPSPSSKTGLGLTYSSRYNRLKVNLVHYDGLMVDSLLQVEDRIIAINHMPFQHIDPSTAAEQIAQSPLWVSIVARKHQDAGVVLTVQDECRPSSEEDRLRTWYPDTRSYDPSPRMRLFPSAHPFVRSSDSRSRLRSSPISRHDTLTQRQQVSDRFLHISNRENPTIGSSASF